VLIAYHIQLIPSNNDANIRIPVVHCMFLNDHGNDELQTSHVQLVANLASMETDS